MIAFLASTLGDFYMMDAMTVPLMNKNEFVENISRVWKKGSKGLMISAYPEGHSDNDRMRDELLRAFSDAGIGFSSLDVCDSRNPSVENIAKYDAIILGGGHVPTQNAFFERIGLFEKIREFSGVLLALSAGSMNSARVVYAGPELPGEATDPNYERWLRGLGITECMMFPHYQYLKNEYLDGLHLINDITLPDSFGKKIYAMPDGSYIKVTPEEEYIFGECHLISDGKIEQICRDDEKIKIR